MKKLFGWTPLACLLVVLGGVLVVAACDGASSPTVPLAPADNVAAAPDSTNLQAGGAGETAEGGQDPGFASQPPPVQQAAMGGQPNVDICHLKGNGTFIIISVAEPSVESHLDHGDSLALTYYRDIDRDGFGSGPAFTGCELPYGYSMNDRDCNDSDRYSYPGAPEQCDGIDNNCNTVVDDGGTCACPCYTNHELRVMEWNPPIFCYDYYPDQQFASSSSAGSAALHQRGSCRLIRESRWVRDLRGLSGAEDDECRNRIRNLQRALNCV